MQYMETLRLRCKLFPSCLLPALGEQCWKGWSVEGPLLWTTAWLSFSQTCRAYRGQWWGATPNGGAAAHPPCGQAMYSFCTLSMNRWRYIPHKKQGQKYHNSFLPPSRLCLHAESALCCPNFKWLHVFLPVMCDLYYLQVARTNILCIFLSHSGILTKTMPSAVKHISIFIPTWAIS